jgi:predicted transcriptional regulator
LHRSVLRFSPDMRDRLDELAGMASTALRRDVPRSAVVRAAVGAWLEANDAVDPKQLIEEIRASLIARGRKRRPG